MRYRSGINSEIQLTQANFENERSSELDALRGIAALFVVLFHLTMWRPQAQLGFNLGVTGVDLFFVISGFVIFKSLGNDVSWKIFVIKRISRLFPAYWVCVTFTFLLILTSDWINNQNNWTLIYNYFINLYMVQYYFNVPDLDGPYWTLIIELLFYLIILIVIAGKKTNHIISIGIVGLLLVSVYTLFLPTDFPAFYKSVSDLFPLIKHFPLFFSGILFYKLKEANSNNLKTVSFTILILSCFCLQLSLYNKGAINNNFVTFKEYGTMLGIYFIIFFLLIYNRLRNTGTVVTKFLGDISYSLYLVHQYLCLVVLLPFFTVNCGLNFWVSSALSLVIVIPLAGLITFYIEKPAGRKMKTFLMNSFVK